MYPVNALQSPATPPQTDDLNLGLRLNQRVTAEILQIAADHVVLGLGDVPVVARLTSPDQSAMLAERRTAQFVVRGFGEQGLILQLASAAAPTPAAELPPELLPALLRQAGRPPHPANLLIAQALLERGLPVTADLVDELNQALAGRPNWGGADAQNAAALKAAGLPLNAEALALWAGAGRDGPALQGRLQASLRALAGLPDLPPRLAELAQTAATVLNQLGLDWGAEVPDLAGQLRHVVATLGRSLEQALARSVGDAPADGLLALAQLRGELAKLGAERPEFEAARQNLDQFLAAARLDHYKNLPPAGLPAEGHWLTVGLPLGQPPQHQAHLRVAYPPDAEAAAIDPRHTHLSLAVPLEDGTTFQVDLSIVDRQMGAWVIAPDEERRAAAEAELPEFQAGLQSLGYQLKTARCELARERAPHAAGARSPAAPRINMEA